VFEVIITAVLVVIQQVSIFVMYTCIVSCLRLLLDKLPGFYTGVYPDEGVFTPDPVPCCCAARCRVAPDPV